MTAEAAIMNRNGVVLAADSAVTAEISSSGDNEIYNSVHKLFRLSDSMGVMVYGSASFLGVPWEIIIKLYKQEISDKKDGFNTVSECREFFVRFLIENKDDFFTEKNIQSYIKKRSYSFFKHISEEIDDEISSSLKRRSPSEDITKRGLEIIAGKVINEYKESLGKQSPIKAINFSAQEFYNKHKEDIEETRDNVFSGNIISKTAREKLLRISKLLLERVFFKESGIVILGFGKDEITPSLNEISIESFICSDLKYRIEKDCNLKKDGLNARLFPFAQTDVPQGFISGIHPDFEKFLLTCLSLSYSYLDFLDFDQVSRNILRQGRQKLYCERTG